MTTSKVRAGVVLGVVLAAGGTSCDSVFGLERPLPPGDQNDEDRDGVVNAVDNCPTVVNAAQIDTDKDSVGDGCDPHAMTTGDRIAERYFFDGPDLDPSSWSGGGWNFLDGYVAQPTLEANAQMVSSSVLDVASLTVEIELVVTAWSSMPFSNATGIVLEGAGGHRCSVQYEAQSHGRIQLTTAGGAAPMEYLMPAPAEGIPIRLVASVDRETGNIECRMGELRVTETQIVPPGPIGVVTQRNAAEIRYVVVYAVD